MNFINHIEEQLTNWRGVTWLYLKSAIIFTSYRILTNYASVLDSVQTNNFDLVGDFIALTVAFIGIAIIIAVTSLIGNSLGWLYNKMFDVAPQAMLCVERIQIKILHLLRKISSFVSKLLSLLQYVSFSIIPLIRQHTYTLPTKFTSQSKIPYQFFALSCVLRN